MQKELSPNTLDDSFLNSSMLSVFFQQLDYFRLGARPMILLYLRIHIGSLEKKNTVKYTAIMYAPFFRLQSSFADGIPLHC